MSILRHFVSLRLTRGRTPAQKPVIEIPLRTPPRCDAIQSFRLLDKRLCLPPFDALAEELALPNVYDRLRFRNARRQGCGDAFGDNGFLDSGDSVHDFAGRGAGRNHPPAAALTFYAPGECLLELFQFRARCVHGRAALLFLNLENLQQAPHAARNRHQSNLRGQGS
jgi:hypothetical protein